MPNRGWRRSGSERTGFRLGDQAYEVEWADKEPPKDDAGDWLHDQVEYHVRYFKEFDQAWAFAKKVYPTDIYGCVMVSPVELVDPYGDRIPRTYIWKDTDDDPVEYSGEEE